MTKPLFEERRPTNWDDLVGQDKIKTKIDHLRKRGLRGRCFWITGASGTGKSTIARLLAAEIADEYATEEINATKLDVATLRDWERKCSVRPIGRGAWAFIVNEAHNLRSLIVEELQTILEAEHVQLTSTWIFTTTIAGNDRLFDNRFSAEPFMSRAIKLELTHGPQLELAFALRCREIAQAEGLDGKPLEEYVSLVKRCRCNMRQALQDIEAGEML